MNDSRYTAQLLITAYDNMQFFQTSIQEAGRMVLPSSEFLENEVDVYFHLPKENADLFMKDLFNIIHKVDREMVQENKNDDYDIAYFNVYENRVDICYFGNKINTEFNVKLCIEAGQWYCTGIGIRIYDPPKYIAKAV